MRAAGRVLGLAILACIASMLLASAGATSAETPPEPAAYRLDDYRAPTPATLAGAVVLSTADAAGLWTAKRAIFVDVLPHAPRPANLPAGTLWRDKPHLSIAGAAWLPEVGRGALAPATEAYFRTGLATLTGGDLDRPLVLFCKASCWMSWNAAKRGLSYGYRHIYWYPDGVDGWAAAQLPMMPAEPRP
jgi:PQQ-dependent catabolism-associated CXXCW motif protein